MVRQADERILKFTQNGMALEPISWPTSLIKVMYTHNEMSNTIVDGND